MDSDRLKHLAVTPFAILFVGLIPVSVGAAPGDETTETTSQSSQKSERTGRLGVESPGAGSRAELTIGQGLHGMALAAELCALARCGMTVGSATTSYAQGRPAIVGASMVAGLGVGIGTSLWATRKGGILPGHATALNSGVIWGASFGALVNFASDNFDVGAPSYGLPVPRSATPALILGQLGGMGLGAGLYQWLEPTQGDVALTNSFGLWGAAFTVGAFGLANDLVSP